MLPLDLLAELFRYGIPNEQVYPERQVAFLECFPEIGNPVGLLRRCEYHHIQIRLRARGPFGAGSIDPRGRARQMPRKQCQNGLALLGGNIDHPVQPHASPLNV